MATAKSAPFHKVFFEAPLQRMSCGGDNVSRSGAARFSNPGSCVIPTEHPTQESRLSPDAAKIHIGHWPVREWSAKARICLMVRSQGLITSAVSACHARNRNMLMLPRYLKPLGHGRSSLGTGYFLSTLPLSCGSVKLTGG